MNTMQTGKYELVSKLAVGGMAEVFLARAAGPMGFEKTLVLKRILPHLAEESGFVEMFLREAKLAAQLNHPHIVQIFDFGEDDGSYFLAMEYIDGPNLRALLKKARASGVSLPPALCARLVASACEGLAFAHDFQDPATGKPLGLIHRDISTDNILVSLQGAVKVVDFGIAKTADPSQKTQTGVLKGKVAYLSPEQIRGKPLDRRVDVYALGVVLYELLTGHKPFEFPTDASLMQAILFEPLPPATQHRPELPQALQRILDRALAREREQRYPDCRAFQLELEDFIVSTGKSVGAYQISQFIASLLSPDKPSRSEDETLPLPPSEQHAERTQQIRTPSLKWMPALAGAALLMMAGGYIAGSHMGRATNPSLPAAPQKPAAPPVELTARELPSPPNLDTSEKPSEPIAQAAEEPQAALPERSGARRSSSQPGRSSPARAQRTGTLLLVVRGWADIWVDGQKKGRVPPINELELPAGRHELKLVNPALKPYRAVITITAGETLEHRVIFQAEASTRQAARSEMISEIGASGSASGAR